MADVVPDVFKIVQSYGGLKEAYFEVDVVTAADVIVFTAAGAVEGIQFKCVTADDDGAFIPCTISSSSGTLKDQLVVGAGPAAEKVVGVIKFRSY